MADCITALCPNRVSRVGEALGRIRTNRVPCGHRGSGAGRVVGGRP